MIVKGYDEGSDITILNTIYQRPYKDDEGNKHPDVMTIIYRDNVTKRKKVEKIESPTYQFYKAMDEFDTGYNQLFIEKEKTEMIEVPYTQLLFKLAEMKGLTNEFYENIRMGTPGANNKLHGNTDIFMSDMNIEDHYRFRFSKEYKNSIYKLNKSYLDIEVDGIYAAGDFPQPGECPINCVTFINEENRKIYTYILRNKNNPLIEEFERDLADPKKNLLKELKDFIIDAVGGYKQAVRYKVIEYDNELFFFDQEIDLIRCIFYHIRELEPDFCVAWNASFDIPYIIARIEALGYNPTDIICDPEMPQVARYYIDERNYNEYEQRGDFATIGLKTVFLDQMIQFASRRKGRGVYPSYKLDFIGGVIAKVKKLNYSHITTRIEQLPYLDFKTFVFYNIMDVVVQLCIEAKTQDIDYIFSKCLMNNTRYEKGHRQTVYLTNRFAKDFFNAGYIIGNNVNKWNEKPKEKFPGALVGDPLKTSDYAKRSINGVPINVVDNMIDFD